MIPRMDQERWGHLDITSDVIRMLCTDIPLLIDAIYQKICDSKNGLGKRKILKFQIKMFCTNILCYQRICDSNNGLGNGGEIFKFSHQNIFCIYILTTCTRTYIYDFKNGLGKGQILKLLHQNVSEINVYLI